MINCENIRSRQLVHFCTLLAESKINNPSYLRRRFLEQCDHFEETLDFLKFYKLISVRKENILFTRKMQRNIHDLDLLGSRDLLKVFFTKLILTEHNVFKNEVDAFLNRFKLEKGVYQLKSIGQEKIKEASLRNFLIDFGIIDLYREEDRYFIPQDVAFYLKVEKKDAILNENEFEAILLERKKMGRKAETGVLLYERNRLKAWKEYLNKIEHTALINIGAGYDVKSFDVCRDKIITRYIEVKAISLLNLRFFWSRNEIEFAKSKEEQYYLYLVPFDKNSDLVLEKIQIIQDPFKRVFNNKKNWTKTDELMSFKKSWTN